MNKYFRTEQYMKEQEKTMVWYLRDWFITLIALTIVTILVLVNKFYN